MRMSRLICSIICLLTPLISYGQQFPTPREAYGEWKKVGFPGTGWDEGGYVYLVATVKHLSSGRALVQVGVAVPPGHFRLMVQPLIVRGMPHEREKRKRGKAFGEAKEFKIEADNLGAARPVASFYDYSLEMDLARRVNALKISITRRGRVVGEPLIVDLTKGISEMVTSLNCPCPP